MISVITVAVTKRWSRYNINGYHVNTIDVY